jgi:antitoxin (DNA-binding transcriptional repressor) of toxin-antitoxin stability system
MVHVIPITKARVNLGEVVRRVYLNKEYFILEKGGIPVAGITPLSKIMDADELEDYLEVHDPKMKKQIKEGYEAYKRGETRDGREFLAELKREFKKEKTKK